MAVICALGVAEIARRSHGSARQRVMATESVQSAAQASAPSDDPPEQRPDYASITQRDLFRPLVKAPKTAGGGGALGPAASAAGSAVAAKAEQGKSGTSGAAQPPDPLADLALTGVIEVGDRLQALIEKVSTRTGRYVSINEDFEGFRVVSIGVDSVVLERAGRQHTLAMGQKQFGERAASAPASASTASEAPKPGPSASSSASSPGAPRGGGMMGGFGGDILAWAESQSLPDLERMYAQYGSMMSPEDRARAEAYLESRRARERGQ